MDALIPPLLSGLTVRRPLGQGPRPPWLAKADDGSWVVIRRGPRPSELPDHPGLVPVFGAVNDAEGEPWVITAYTTGSGLDRRLERVGAVGGTLAARWLTVLAGALAALHDAGLVHGDVCAGRVLLGPRDTVLLDASCAHPGDEGAKAADVAALAALLEDAAGEPLRGGVSPAPSPRRRRPPGRRARRGVLVVAALAGLLVGAAALGLRLAGTREQPALLAVADDTSQPSDASATSAAAATLPTTPVATPTSTQQPDAPDWASVLEGLDAMRGLAFETADAGVLRDVDAPGSEAERRDLALVRTLSARGVTADGWATTLVSVVPRSVRPTRVVLLVTDTRSAYVLRGIDAAVEARQEARGPSTWVVRLVASGGGWRIASVDVAAAPAPS